MTTPLAVTVLGAGNWGTTLAHIIAARGHSTRVWSRDAEQCKEINTRRTNQRSAPGLRVHSGVQALTDLERAVHDAELVLLAIPSQAFRSVCRELCKVLRPDQYVIHGTKGLEAETHRRMSEIMREETRARQIGVLSGPNIAAEVGQGKPAGTVVASPFPRVIELGQQALSSPQMMVFAGSDVVGVELAGALKNVVAIAAGIADEIQVGDNAKAFLVTRGLLELMQLSVAMGATPLTFAGLAGIGDLMVTCASPLSRNHRIGVALARGEPLDEAVARLGMVAEGVYASSSAHALARIHGIEMPLFDRVERILRHGLSAKDALAELMELPAGHDPPASLFPGAR